MTAAVTLATLGNGPCFSAYPSAAQSVPSSTYVKVQFNTKEYDTNTNYDSTNYRFTPTVAGYYLITSLILFTSQSNSTTGIYSVLYKNGSIYRYQQQASSTVGCSVFNSQTIYLNGSTDYVEHYVYQNSGGTCNICINGMTYNYFQAALVRGA